MTRIAIELMAPQHAAAILSLIQAGGLSATSSVPEPCTFQHVDRWIADNRVVPPAALSFVVLAGDEIVGAVTLKRLDAADQSGELAYWIGRMHQGKGYAKAAARLAIEYGFERLQLRYLHAHYLRGFNPASGKVLVEACGFEPDLTKPDLPVADRFARSCPGDQWTFVRLERAGP